MRLTTQVGVFFILIFNLCVFSQTPNLVNGLPSQDFPGKEICFDLSLTNTGDPGYNPYIRLILPTPALTYVSAQYLGINVATQVVGTFPAAPGNQLTDPITGDTVTGQEGYTFMILTIPLGSIVEGGPPTVVNVCANFDTAAIIGNPYPVTAQPVYEHGDTATGVNGPIVGASVTSNITPIVWTAIKENDAHEYEMPPSDGSNYFITYTLTIDVAETKTVSNVVVNDTLPSNLQYVSPITITGGTGVTIDVEPSEVSTGGNIQVSFSSITGTSSNSDVTITYRGYIVDILDETNCSTSLLTNNVTFDGEYASAPLPQITDSSDVTAKHICIQKGASPSGITPGDTVTYTLNFQVTDFGTADSLVIVDTISDGLTFDAHQSMTISGSTVPITPNVVHNADGTTIITYDVHAATGDLSPATTGTITYTATVDQIYESDKNVQTNPDYVLASDTLSNSVVANYSLTAGASGCSDNSGASVTVVPITISKEVINPQSEYTPGEFVTYRLTMNIPSGDTHNVIFEDFFPLPIFNVSTLDTNTNLGANTSISLAPTDTMGLTPTGITVDVPTNSLRITWPDVITTSAQTISVDIDIVVEDDPFADNLFLTNLFQAYTYNSPLAVASDIDPVQIHVRAPELVITKGIIASDNAVADATISPPHTTLPADGNISSSDASDTVTFQITVENIGGASAYDVIIKDPSIAGLGTYSIISVQDGSGTNLAYSGNINGGITLTNPLDANDGSIGAPYGTGTAIITYTAQIDSNIEAGSILVNTADVVWASQSGAVKFGAITDTATVTISGASVNKTVTAIAPGYAGNLTDVHIGEVVTYQVVITVPEGLSSSVNLVDTLDSGLAFTDVVSINSSSADITTDFAGGYSGVLANAAFSNSDQTLTLDFGNITNANTVDGTAETITVVYRARVLNTSANVRGQNRNNNAHWTSTNVSANDRAPNVTIIEPTLDIASSFSNSTPDAGDTLTITIDIAHNALSNGDAFDLTLSDVIPTGLTFAGNLTTSGLAPTTGPSESGGIISVSWDSFPQGSTAQITFDVTVDASVNPDETIQNDAVLEWESLLTADQGSLPTCPNNTLGVERTGNTSDPGGTVNTYTNTGSDSITIANATIVKVISLISPNGAPGFITCGDLVTYAFTVTLPEGLVPSLILIDDLPAGLQYQSVSVDTTGYNGTVNSSPTVGITGTVTTGQTITLTFGDTTTANDNDVSNNSFVVNLTARVNDDVANSGLPVVSNKTNTVTLDYTGNSSTLSDTASINFAEPQLTITKTMSPNTDVDSGDTITIQLVVENTGTAPAHNIVVTDDMSSATGLFDLSTVAEGTTPAGFTYSYTNPTVTYTGSGTLAAGDSVTFTFTANVISSVVTGSAYQNAASVIGDSQTGVVIGERSTSDSASATLTVADVTRSKALVATSENSTDPGDASLGSNPQVAIGEVLTYEISFAFPEGVTNNVELIDILPSGLTYLSGSASLRKTSTALTSVDNPGTINETAINTPVFVTLDTSVPGQVSLALGNVTNTDSNNTTTEQYILSLQAVVANIATNNAGTELINSGRLTYDNVNNVNTGVNSNSVTVHVAEPTLSITKSASPATIDGGDLVTFTVVVSNTGSGTNSSHLFDGTFTDVLPAEFKSTPAPSVTNIDLTNTTMTSGDVVASFTGTTLNGIYTDLAPGESFEITYTAVVDESVPFGSTITNTVSTTGTSLPGDHGTANATAGNPGGADGERNGSGGVNDLTTSDNASVTLSQPTLSKTTNNYLPPYAISEEAEFQITIGVPLGTTTNFVLTDVLDSGLDFVGGSLTVTMTPGISISNTPLNESNTVFFDLTGNTLTLTFGTITSSVTGSITVTYKALVENVIANQVGQIRDNSVSVVFDDPNNPGSQISVGPIATDKPIVIGEPNLQVSKSITAGAVNSNAGDTISWQITIQNTGNLPAYRVYWSDILPAGLNQISNAILTISGGNVYLNGTTTALNSSSYIISTTVEANDTISLPLFEIENGATLTITFDSVLMDTVTPGLVLNNVTSVNYNSLSAGGGRDNSSDPGNVDDDVNTDLNNYEERASQSLIIGTGLSIDKTVDKSSCTIGEEVKFSIKVDLIEGTTENVVVTDILPTGFTYVSHLITAGNTGMTFQNSSYNTNLGSGQTVLFDFGDIVNPGNNIATDNYFIVEITAKVENILANQNATILRNGENADSSETYVTYGPTSTRVDFDYDGGTAGIQGIPVTITEPNLSVTKTVTPTTQSLGDKVTYTINVAHTGASTSDAYDLVLTDTLPDGLTYVANSATLPGTDVTVAGQVIEFRISSLTLADSSTSFTYEAIVDNDTTAGTILTNNIDLEWSSIPSATGASDNGRNGIDGASGLNNYVANDSVTVTSAINTFIDVSKTVTIFEDNGTPGQLDPGDMIEYTVTLINTNGPATGVVFYDTLPPEITFVTGSLLSSVGVEDESSAPDLSVNIGNMASTDVVTITFRATVNAGIAPGTVISNQGYVDSDSTVPEPTDEDGIDGNGDQPTDIIVGDTSDPVERLYVSKVVNWLNDADVSSSITTLDTMRYTILFSNLGTTDLTGITFADTIPTGLTYVLGSATISAVGGSVSVTGQSVTAVFPSLTITDLVSLSFDVTIDNPLVNFDGNPLSEVFVNQGTATSNETASILTDGNGDPTDGDQPTQFTAITGGTANPIIDVEKRWFLDTDLNGNCLVNPLDTVLYTISIANTGAVTATNVRLTDAIPANMTYVSSSVSTSKGAVYSETPTIGVNIGDIAPSETVSISFKVTVNAGTANGTIIPNQATVIGDNFADEPSDDNGNEGDGKNPTLIPVNDGNSSSGVPTLVKELIATSEIDTSGFNLLIGEQATFRLTITMPSGTVKEVSIVDSLPVGLSYVPNSATLSRVFDTGLQASSNPGNINGIPSNNSVALVDGSDFVVSGQDLSVFLGDVINSDNDANDEHYVLEFQVVVDNVLSNQSGTVLNNTGQVRYLNSLSQAQFLNSNTVSLNIVEANLFINKTITAGDVGSFPGDTISYSLEITNISSGASAYNVNLVDVLPVDLQGGVGASGTAPYFFNIDLTNPSNTVVFTNSGIPVNVTDIDLSSPETLVLNNFTLPPGTTLTITYDVTVSLSAAPDAVIDSSASVYYSSLPSGAGRLNTDPGSDDDNDSDLNNYNEQDTVTLILCDEIVVTATVENGTVEPAEIRLCRGDGNYAEFVFKPKEGFHIVSYEVNGNAGCFCPNNDITRKTLCNLTEDTHIHVKYVKSEDPVISNFIATPDSGLADLHVTYYVTAYDPDEINDIQPVCHEAHFEREIKQYQWDFNDDGIIDTITRDGFVSHIFALPGVYATTVVIVDNEMTKVKSERLIINVAKKAVSYLPVNLLPEISGILLSENWLINNNNFNTEISIIAENNDGEAVFSQILNLKPFGKTKINLSEFNEKQYEGIKILSNQSVIVYNDMKTDTGLFTTYLNQKLSRNVIAPHIAEDYEFWTTYSYLMNTGKKELQLNIFNNKELVEGLSSYLIDLTPLGSGDANRMYKDSKGYGEFTVIATDPFSDTDVLSGFEFFSFKDGDTAGVELIEDFEESLYLPFIPNSSDKFWAGFALVNTEYEKAEVSVEFFDFYGSNLGIYNFEIDANSKKKVLISDMFPDIDGNGSWAKIISTKKLAGIEIFGSFKEENSGGGICGFSLSGRAKKKGILPFVNGDENQWTGIAITNINTQEIELKLELVNQNGQVKETKYITIDKLSQFKTLIRDIFIISNIEKTDYIRFSSEFEVLAVEIGGTNDWGKMKALTSTN